MWVEQEEQVVQVRIDPRFDLDPVETFPLDPGGGWVIVALLTFFLLSP